MLKGTYPGVYTREEPSGVRTISGVSTAIAAFVGPTLGGVDNRPRRVLNFGDFERVFGGLAADSELSYGVLHFFKNGGGEAIVVRAARENSVPAKLEAKNAGGATLRLEALGSGSGGNEIYVEIDSLPGTKAFSLFLSHAKTGAAETFSGLSTEANNMRFAPSAVNDPDLGSQLVKIGFVANGQDAPLPTGMTIKAAPPANLLGKKAAKDYSFKVGVTRIVGAPGAKEDVLAETDIDLFAKDEILPPSLLAVAKRMEEKVNIQLQAAGKAARVEGRVLEYGSEPNKVRLLRFRTRAADLADGNLAPDAVIEIKDGGKPMFADFGLSDAKPNASRYRLGFDYGADAARVQAMNHQAGGDGSTGFPSSAQLKSAMKALEKSFFNLLCVPDAVRPSSIDPTAVYYPDYLSIYDDARKLCEDRRAFLLLDPPPHVNDVTKAEAWKSLELTVRSNHAATYFPRLKMPDPLNPGSLRPFAPSGAMAGVMARTDANRGVWKSPAGIDATVADVYAPAVELSDAEHGVLNPIGVNCFRRFPIYGNVAFGARTLAGADEEASPWKYISVRRTALYILESLRRGLAWVTFEPNDEPLWGQIRMNVGAFMHGLFRQGAFQGKSPALAYLVKCDSETTTQTDINLGVVNVIVGFAPLKPAEFVFLTLRQLAGQAQT